MVIELLTLSTYQVVIRQIYHTQHFLYPEIRYVFVFERQKEREREERESIQHTQIIESDKRIFENKL